ncbi:MAG: glycosyltransferase family 4 protein [Robiginitomaculum sp.]|nr:glycosyltransferase family 4 protein [Robiginitomaculum sp.]
MKIVQIIPELAAGGAERTTLDISRAIIASGGSSLVLTKGGRLVEELQADGAAFYSLPLDSKNPLIMWKNITAIAEQTKKFGGEIIHARSRAPAWSALAAVRRLNLPFVTTYHGTYNSSSILKTKYNSIMTKGDLVIANSNFVAAHIAKTHNIDPKKIRVIPRGIDLDGLRPEAISKKRKLQVSSRLDIALNKDIPLILMPGRLTRWKGQLVMVKAMDILRQRGIAAHLVMPGDAQGRDDYKTELQNRIADLGLEKAICLPGHITDMAAAYSISNIVVSASIEPEAFGRVAVEGQAAAKPVIATAHGGSLETVQDKNTGLLVEAADPTAMADALQTILSLTKNQQEEWGKKGQKWVSQQYSREQMCASTLAVYQEVLQQRN